MKLVIFGNCQAGPLGNMIAGACPEVEILRVPPVHLLKSDEHLTIVEGAIHEADVVLSQPIGPVFKQFSSESLKSLAGDKPWVTFPSIYFGGLFPHLTYMRKPGGTLVGPLGDYHDRRIALSFARGETVEECEISLTREDETGCRAFLNAALDESRRRESGLDFKVMDFIEATMPESRPFFTFNHPSNDVMWSVVTQFIKLFDLTTLQGASARSKPYLDETVAAIPIEMSRIAGLKYVDPVYTYDRQPQPYGDLIERFFAVYRNTNDMEAILKRNGIDILNEHGSIVRV